MTIPSLNTLRAFEAAVRLESFAKAADHLGLTHSAISHQMRHLGDLVGAPLFVRQGRRMIATDTGRALLVTVREALTLLQGTFETPQLGSVLRLTTLPSFSALWLSPRLPGYFDYSPGARIDLNPTTQPVDLGNSRSDVAIRFGLGGWAEVEHTLLGHEWIVPICSPALLGHEIGMAPADVAKLPLIDDPTFTWATWFEAMGCAPIRYRPVISVADSSIALNMVTSGIGVALARLRLIYREVLEGKLVQLVDAPIQTRQSYYFVTGHASNHSNVIDSFRQWIVAEFAADSVFLGEITPSTLRQD